MNKNNHKRRLKEPVRLRVKPLANGNKSLYLDTYYKGKRTYEFLRLYLIPEKTSADKALNAATMRAATVIKARRILAYVNGKANIKTIDYKPSLHEWIEKIMKVKTEQHSETSIRLMKRLSRHLLKFRPSSGLADINREYCVGFVDYLRSARALNSDKQLMQATQFELQNAFSYILNEAVRDELIDSNPMRLLNSSERIKSPESSREYLTPEEVKSMMGVAYKNIADGDDVAAFLFSCFCGLRYSDVLRLKWKNIINVDNRMIISTTMKKTHRRVDVPVSEIAASILPESGAPDSRVFTFPRYGVTLNKLKYLAKSAGIKKK